MKLSEICSYRSGRVKSNTLSVENYISTENMLPNKSGVSSASKVPPEAAVLYKKGDILISNIRPYFKKIWQAQFSGGCSSDVLCIRANSRVNQDYLYYLLSQDSFFDYVMSGAKGSKMPRGDKKQIMDWDVELPKMEEQIRIASLLRSIDDKIELNNRINHNLEEQAQALYKSWFVDFEPFKGLDFIDSDLGMIPSSLKIKQISTVKHILETGKRPKGGVGDLSFGIPSIGAESIKGLGYFDSSKVKYISEDFATTLKKGWIDGYELLIYKDGGKPGYFIPNYNIFGEGFPYDRMCLNEHVFKLDFLDRGLNAFAYFYFHSEYVFNYLNAQGGKAAIPGINQKDIESLWIFDPNNENVRLFSERVSPLITAILNNCRCNMELAKTRDMLLPKLMSGELKIDDFTC